MPSNVKKQEVLHADPPVSNTQPRERVASRLGGYRAGSRARLLVDVRKLQVSCRTLTFLAKRRTRTQDERSGHRWLRFHRLEPGQVFAPPPSDMAGDQSRQAHLRWEPSESRRSRR